jgi:hypothetical protein
MAKLMGSKSGSINTGALKAMPNDGSNATGSLKAADGSFDAQKYAPTATSWTPTPQIHGDRFTNFRGQGEVAALATLAANAQLPRFPVDLIELEKRHFTRT